MAWAWSVRRYICNAKFFEGKATEVLLGKGVEAKHLNDDRLGRVLDQLWRKDLSQLFMKVSLKAVQQYGVEVEVVHLDSTSFAVEGEYADSPMKSKDSSPSVLPKSMEQESSSSVTQTTDLASSIQIRRGYSRDHRPDLKQFVMNLVCSGDGGIPLFLSMADGNQVDTQVFGLLMQGFSQQWQFEGVHVLKEHSRLALHIR